MTSPRFLFAVCQKGAEGVCKQEILANHPEFKPSFSRPGFVTFKCEYPAVPEKLTLKTSFARTYGWSVGSLKIIDAQSQIEQLCQNPWLNKSAQIHVFQRDSDVPGSRGFEPGISVLATEIGSKIEQQLAAIGNQAQAGKPMNRNARPQELVFDVAIVDPDQWFVGYHFAQAKFQRWPGGVPRVDIEHQVVSRAYFKLQEALLWSGIQIQPGDVCAEIGASPGGACQWLLEKGARVIAVDPAELEPEIAEHPNLTYIQARGREIRKKDLQSVRWLISDINVAPKYTLDTIEDIVTNQYASRVRGVDPDLENL